MLLCCGMHHKVKEVAQAKGGLERNVIVAAWQNDCQKTSYLRERWILEEAREKAIVEPSMILISWYLGCTRINFVDDRGAFSTTRVRNEGVPAV